MQNPWQKVSSQVDAQYQVRRAEHEVLWTISHVSSQRPGSGKDTTLVSFVPRIALLRQRWKQRPASSCRLQPASASTLLPLPAEVSSWRILVRILSESASVVYRVYIHSSALLHSSQLGCSGWLSSHHPLFQCPPHTPGSFIHSIPDSPNSFPLRDHAQSSFCVSMTHWRPYLDTSPHPARVQSVRCRVARVHRSGRLPGRIWGLRGRKQLSQHNQHHFPPLNHLASLRSPGGRLCVCTHRRFFAN